MTDHLSGGLNERSRATLRSLIQEFVRTGKPVGSRRLAKLDKNGLSAATLRNVVADLEEAGFVTQPHTSAGRVPTACGYRFYVDSLLGTRKLSSSEVDRIKRSLEEETDLGGLMNKTSQVLARLSNNVGFVLVPPLSRTVMKHVKFILLSEHRILIVLVSRSGQVQHRAIVIEESLTQGELDQAGNYLVTHFEGKTLLEIRDELIKLMAEEKALYNRLLQTVILLGSASLITDGEDTEKDSEVYVGGTSRIIDKLEAADVSRLIGLFETFEQKSQLVRILTECLQGTQVGPVVTIGLEKHLPGMRDFALVSSSYSYGPDVMGTLGILGPCRMEYEKTISLVDYVAKLFGRLMNESI